MPGQLDFARLLPDYARMPGLVEPLELRKPSREKEEIEMTKCIRTISSMALAAMLALAVTQNSVFAKDQACSNASLQGAYGFHQCQIRNGAPVGILGQIVFDGKGNWTATLT